MIEILQNARESCMTLKFHKKVDDKYVKEQLQESIKAAKDLKDNKKMTALAKELVMGPDCEMTCCLTGSENNKLGRSNVLDLNVKYGMNFRQVDHRTLEEITIKNVKYTLKN